MLGFPRIAHFFIFLLACLGGPTFAQDMAAYRIFDSTGKASSYSQMVQTIQKADVVFFGEIHTDAMSHWLQLQVLKSLQAQHPRITLALEMFEADDQPVLDEYLEGHIEERHLLKEAKIWQNYATDYRPMVEFAKAHKLPVIASNIPRRYANLVHRKGLQALEALSPQAKTWIAPLPITVDLDLPGYKNIITSMGAKSTQGSPEDLARAQAVKDATMAHFLAQAQGKVFHVNGSYHSKNGEGIIGYLRQTHPALSSATIHVAAQNHIEQLDDAHKGLADFIIAVPKDMAQTHQRAP